MFLLRRVISCVLVAAVTRSVCAQATQISGPDRDGSAVLRYLPEDVVGVAAIQPAAIVSSPYVQSLVRAGAAHQELHQAFEDLIPLCAVDMRTVAEMAVLFDEQTLQQIELRRQSTKERQHLKWLGLAAHNFHDVFDTLPDDDGPDGPNKGNLSWRVWLLPMVNQDKLFRQFRLDESWKIGRASRRERV